MHPMTSFFHLVREKTNRLLQSTDLCVPQTGASNICPNGNYSVVVLGHCHRLTPYTTTHVHVELIHDKKLVKNGKITKQATRHLIKSLEMWTLSLQDENLYRQHKGTRFNENWSAKVDRFSFKQFPVNLFLSWQPYWQNNIHTPNNAFCMIQFELQ